MFDWLRKFIGIKKPCEHKQNYKHRLYRLGDGTPMSEYECFDCSYWDLGAVNGVSDDEKWYSVRVVKNGVVVEEYE